MAETTPPILDLDTLIKRPVIAIDGKRYEILSPDELSVLDHHRLTTQGKRLDELLAGPDLEPEDERELSKLLADITDWIMVGVPAEVREKLSDAQRMEVGEVFTALPLRKHLMNLMQEAGAGTKKPGKPPIGGRRSRSSRSSTAATPTDGLGRSLSRVLGRS